MISIVCVYNNRSLLDEFLARSLRIQTVEYELILLDNTAGRYRSAAEALNIGGGRAKGDYIMFAHQDLALDARDWLEKAESVLRSLDNLGVAGVAGKGRGDSVISSIFHGIPKKRVGDSELSDPVRVETVDECLFFVRRGVFNQSKLDESVCGGWHLYCVDYCLTLGSAGFDTYVLPSSIHHRSSGSSMSAEYYETLNKVRRKHKRSISAIRTTSGNWDTRKPIIVQRIMKYIKRISGISKGNRLSIVLDDFRDWSGGR